MTGCRTVLGRQLRQTHPALKKTVFSETLILALRDAFLTMDPAFTSDAASIQCAHQMIPRDGVVKVLTAEWPVDAADHY